ncbi:hypothetical protein GCK32_015372 [Trichostrongylus colubriformis]|uniref:Alpha/beta hydrolase fold-3 domain-containing protein n=1 Tax=Trichostrongylus colubriformis TaxID=6319 RepID=A0AAN8EUG9_TRICO
MMSKPTGEGVDDAKHSGTNFLSDFNTGFEDGEVLQKYDIDREKICIVDDSAGENLAAVVAQRFARRNEHFIKDCNSPMRKSLSDLLQIKPLRVLWSYRCHFSVKYNGTTLLSPRAMARMMLLYLDIPATRRNIELLTASQHISKKLRSSAEFRKVLCLEKDFDPYERFPLRIRKPDGNDEAQMKAFANKGADPDVSALFGVRRDLPPAMVVTAEFDVLRDEAIQYAKKLQEVGVPCEWKHYKTAFHGLCTLPDTPVAKHIIEDVCCFLDGNL